MRLLPVSWYRAWRKALLRTGMQIPCAELRYARGAYGWIGRKSQADRSLDGAFVFAAIGTYGMIRMKRYVLDKANKEVVDG